MSSRGWLKRLASIGCLFGLLALFAMPAQAQVSANANISATATVIGVTPIAATGVNDLQFGAILADGNPWVPTDLASQAGRWNITGEPSANISIDFTLPAVLDDGFASTIPITFGATDGLEWSTYPTANTTFDPNATHNAILDATGLLVIGISGTVTPPITAVSGIYTGTITMTVAYF